MNNQNHLINAAFVGLGVVILGLTTVVGTAEAKTLEQTAVGQPETEFVALKFKKFKKGHHHAPKKFKKTKKIHHGHGRFHGKQKFIGHKKFFGHK
ncbi:MAG: hypothetical protein AAF329_06965 [Cyanobacteria bacterium P01_A01_bin.17]